MVGLSFRIGTILMLSVALFFVLTLSFVRSDPAAFDFILVDGANGDDATCVPNDPVKSCKTIAKGVSLVDGGGDTVYIRGTNTDGKRITYWEQISGGSSLNNVSFTSWPGDAKQPKISGAYRLTGLNTTPLQNIWTATGETCSGGDVWLALPPAGFSQTTHHLYKNTGFETSDGELTYAGTLTDLKNDAIDNTTQYALETRIQGSQTIQASSATSRQLPSDGNPFTVYKKFAAGEDTYVVKCNDPNCDKNVNGVEKTTLIGSMTSVGSPISSSLGSSGYPIVLHSFNQFTKCNSADCSLRETSQVGPNIMMASMSNPSLILANDGLPFFVFYDSEFGGLKAVKCNDTACKNNDESVVNIATDVALNPSSRPTTALSSDGFPVAAYINTSDQVRAIRCYNSTCSSRSSSNLVDSSGSYPSLGISSLGYPLVAYKAVGSVKVASCTDAACAGAENISIADSSQGGASVSLAIPKIYDQKPVFARDVSTAFRVAKCNDNTCQGGNEPYQAIEPSTSDLAVSLDAIENPVVSYRDPDTYLKLLHCNDRACDPNVNGPESIKFVYGDGQVILVCQPADPDTYEMETTPGDYNAGFTFTDASLLEKINLANLNIRYQKQNAVSLNAPTIQNNSITGSTLFLDATSPSDAIKFEATTKISSNLIDNNQITSSRKDAGITLGGGIFFSNPATSLDGNTISRNVIQGHGADGINLQSSLISSNSIIRNAIQKNGGDATELFSASTVSSNVITNNLIAQNSSYGLWFNGGTSATLSSNKVFSNTLDANTLGNLSLQGSTALSSGNALRNNITTNTASIAGILTNILDSVKLNSNFNYIWNTQNPQTTEGSGSICPSGCAFPPLGNPYASTDLASPYAYYFSSQVPATATDLRRIVLGNGAGPGPDKILGTADDVRLVARNHDNTKDLAIGSETFGSINMGAREELVINENGNDSCANGLCALSNSLQQSHDHSSVGLGDHLNVYSAYPVLSTSLTSTETLPGGKTMRLLFPNTLFSQDDQFIGMYFMRLNTFKPFLVLDSQNNAGSYDTLIIRADAEENLGTGYPAVIDRIYDENLTPASLSQLVFTKRGVPGFPLVFHNLSYSVSSGSWSADGSTFFKTLLSAQNLSKTYNLESKADVAINNNKFRCMDMKGFIMQGASADVTADPDTTPDEVTGVSPASPMSSSSSYHWPCTPYKKTILESRVFDTGYPKGVAYNTITWMGVPASGERRSVQLQFATSNSSSGPWEYMGPLCLVQDSDTYWLGGSGKPVEIRCFQDHYNKQYFRYKLMMFCEPVGSCPQDGDTAPRVDEVRVNYSP